MSAFKVSVGATPQSGATVDGDVVLVKPAVLYGDQVTLYSPVAATLGSLSYIAHGDEDVQFAFLAGLDLAHRPSFTEGVRTLQALRHKKRRTPAELKMLMGARKVLRQAFEELAPTVDEMLETAGAGELMPAIDAGLLEIHPIVEDGDDDVIEALLAHVNRLIADASTYPMFDSSLNSILRAAAEEGKLMLAPSSSSRGKQAALAADLLGRLPSFPHATMAEIIDIRAELRDPLVRFRSAMVDLSSDIESTFYDNDFAGEVNDVWVGKVRPEILHIEELVSQNRYLQRLCGIVAQNATRIVGAGVAAGTAVGAGLLGVGVSPVADLPALLTGVSTVAGMALEPLWERKVGATQLREHRFYLLHATEKMAARRAS